ncbi:alkaline phosphatase PafA [Pontibacter mangrovi]|uniref:Alkaline phosphatase family protein n=1 Tax=Pontibacter mangrovi TaxID=2589816 RepID=A0A501W9Y1_9BACT|nr:alkaline phosphatase PafA [Pontibacter mangrovi]TPE42376.1 alkaline phosphatase family protein [Pontibacter mangrovi]
MRNSLQAAGMALLLLTACRSQQPVAGLPSPPQNQSSYTDRPKLVVGIIIDQFRPDYLQRFYAQFGAGGFRRLMTKGYYNRNTHYNYVPTVTGPGHASVYAGTTPAVHGIVANSWYSRELGRALYCAEDTLVKPVGSETGAGKRSPRNLLATNISDALKLSTNGQGKVVGVAVKDRGAIMPAGHLADGAYWFDSKEGRFISSTYYMEALPEWVNHFNARQLPQQYMDSTWHTLLPLTAYEGPDETPYERVFQGKQSAVFPYDLRELGKANGGYGLLTYTPYANTMVTELAMAAVAGEGMGQDEVPDLLALSYSSTDILGHSFGPRSVEVQDMYLRLDRDLEHLLAYLDHTVGQGAYAVFLTADHAAAEVPRYLTDRKVPAGYFSQKGMRGPAEDFLRKAYGVEGLVAYVTNQQVYLNRAVVRENGLDLHEVQQKLAGFLREMDGVMAVYTGGELQQRGYPAGNPRLLQKGYHYKRSGDVFLVLEPGWLDGGKVGTTHGTGYNYDTHVPLLWYGWRIKPGSSARKQSITDIAPTLSFMLDIMLPSGADGEPILEVLP